MVYTHGTHTYTEIVSVYNEMFYRIIIYKKYTLYIFKKQPWEEKIYLDYLALVTVH